MKYLRASSDDTVKFGCHGPLRPFIADESSWACMECSWIGWPIHLETRYGLDGGPIYLGWHSWANQACAESDSGEQ